MWWLILCVHLTELTDVPIASKTLFLGMIVRVFLKEIRIWVGILSKEDCPRQGSGHLHLWGLEQSKKQGKYEFSLCLSWNINLPLALNTGILVLISSDSDQDLYTTGSPASQAFRCGLSCSNGFHSYPVCRWRITAWPS